MNEDKSMKIIVTLVLVAIALASIMLVVTITNNPTEGEEFEFLKAFAYDNTSDPDWECKKTLGLYELAKQSYPHFIENTKWLADKHCGFDVSIITP